MAQADAVTAIDRAAGGFIRHRFVRALNASWVVLVVFTILALTVGGSVHTAQQEGQQAWALPIIAVLFLGPIVLGVGLAGAIVELIHRRIIAFVVLIFAALALAFSAAGAPAPAR